MRRLLLAAALAASSTSQAASADAALARVPEPVRADWDRRADLIAGMTLDLEARRGALELQRTVEAADQARDDLGATLNQASNLAAMARADLQRARLARADARLEVRTAKLEEARSEDLLRAARGDRTEVKLARERLREARTDLRDDRRDRGHEVSAARRTTHTAKRQLRVAERLTEQARDALNDVGAIGPGVYRRRTDAREVAVLEARRDLAQAELERDRALAAIEHGARISLEPFLDAVEAARAALRTAEGRSTGGTVRS